MLRSCLTYTILTALAAPGCTTVDGDNILTSGVYAGITAMADGSGQTRVSAALYVESPSTLDFIELGEDDDILAYGPNAQEESMAKEQLLGVTTYAAYFDADAEDDEFIVELERAVDSGAPDSRATLPAPFELDTEGGFTASRAEDVVVEYSPAGSPDEMTWELSGTCIETAYGAIDDDTGTFTIAAGSVNKEEAGDRPDSCEVTLDVRRTRAGDLDPGYGDGRIQGRQQRSLTFTSEA